ncbi:MAG TPA: response regulator [bacterium]|nr:response regulator [bacterium]
MNDKVIIVDDEKSLLELYCDIFEETEYTVFAETNPVEALDTIQDENIQVMFFDLKMPEMSGLDLCRKIREKNSIALIHAITGHSSLFELSEVREAGFDDYFNKPISPGLLMSAADQAFDKMKRWSRK